MLTWVALLIFIVTYALIISEKVNRAVIALLGAVIMVFAGILDVHKVFQQYIEWETITLLIGMMILVGITNQTGVFQYVAIRRESGERRSLANFTRSVRFNCCWFSPLG